MITIKNEIEYYTLSDEQGCAFGEGRIFEGLAELKKQFEEWGDIDGINVTQDTITDCLETWGMKLYKWNRYTFEEVEYKETTKDIWKFI